MSDLSYWLSWFVYYSIVNTLTSGLAAATLMINVFKYSSGWMIWFNIWLYGEALWGEIVFMQALFKKSKHAGLVSAVIYMLLTAWNLYDVTPGWSHMSTNIFIATIP